MKMKKIITVLLLSCTLFCLSQHQKGDITISISASPLTTETNSDIGIIGKAGLEVFLSEKFSFGGSFFISDNTVLKNESGTPINSYGLIPSIHYYFINQPKINVFGQLGYGYGVQNTKNINGGSDDDALTIFSIGVGLNYRLNDKLQLQLLLPYFDAQNITKDETAADGVAIFLGFNFKL